MTFLPEGCPNCGGVFPCHNYPCNGGSPVWPTWPAYAPMPKEPDDRRYGPLTEADVRRSVREELAKQEPKP